MNNNNNNNNNRSIVDYIERQIIEKLKCLKGIFGFDFVLLHAFVSSFSCRVNKKAK